MNNLLITLFFLYILVQSIKEKIQSLDHKGCKVEITTLDAQYSHDKNGVIVLVTGFFIRKDKGKRKFTQTFYLARKTQGYYVANDIFRFLELIETSTSLIVNNIATENVPNSPLTSDKGALYVCLFVVFLVVTLFLVF